MNFTGDKVFLGARVLSLIPHKKPMRMIDGLTYISDKKVGTSFSVDPNDLFTVNDRLSEAGIIENIAQTACIRIGYDHVMAFNGKIEDYIPPFGYIGAINGLNIYDLPFSEDGLETEVITHRIMHAEQFDINFVEARSKVGDKLIAECEMKLFLHNG